MDGSIRKTTAVERPSMVAANGSLETTPPSPIVPIHQPERTAEEALALSAKELGLHMSLRAGVSFLESSEGHQSSGLGAGTSFDTLRHQADVSAQDKLGSLLVDQDEHRHNLRLWIEILQFRQRLDGLAGIVAVWQGMRQRGVELPVVGEEADILWPTLIRATIDEHKSGQFDLLTYVVGLKQRTGEHYASLYELIVGSYLRVKPSVVRPWHKRLSDAGLVSSEALRHIMPDAVHSPLPTEAFSQYRQLYRRCLGRDLYDACIGEALRLENSPAAALPWHSFLVKNGDGPSQAMFARPEVQRLFALDGNHSLPMVHRKGTAQPKALDVALPQYPAMSRGSMSSLVGDVHGIKPKNISDTFVAKMFATRAFTLDIVIRGLGFFAVSSLGPVALREMAVRSGSPAEFCNHLPTLKALDINIDDNPYCRLLQNLAKENQVELFHALLSSDQHPEAYSDLPTQEALLATFLDIGNWIQAHLTLLCLSQAGAALHAGAWNRVVQHYLRQRQYLLSAQTIEHLQTQKSPLTFTTLTFLHRYMLPLRRKTKRPVESQRFDRPPFDALKFVTNAVIYADNNARVSSIPENYVRPRVWRELLKRYGMAHRWPEVDKLVGWLVERYSTEHFQRTAKATETATEGRVVLRPSCPLHFIFDAQMQQALFNWGFRNAALRHQLRPVEERAGYKSPPSNASAETWIQGFPLLQHLRRRGVTVKNDTVRQAFCLRMWILFGPGHSKIPLNEAIRRENRLPLAYFIRTFNAFWQHYEEGGLAFDIDERLLTEPELQPELLLAFFGKAMRAGKRKVDPAFEYVHVEGWARAVGRGEWGEGMRGRTAMERKRVWGRNPFRFAVLREAQGVRSEEGKKPG